MKITMNDGQPVIDAACLATLLGLTAQDVQEKMRAGEITTRFETGEGADAGRMCLTFLHGNNKTRLSCLEDGAVLKTLRADIGGR